ncbi:uncharacterized protein LOC134274555 [Saccostrea cucullata]|uniref:uncharacterized protein LOC134274555 n=1 Tax=Saccostrea cuccullata TaxID=36930 RepID=UPI002ED27A3F
MSLSKQVAIQTVCDFCESEVNVKWFCRDCVNNMCVQCKRTHTKIPLCKSHVILPINESLIAPKKQATVHSHCTEHAQACQFQCRTCNKEICVLCLTTTHKSHDFLALNDHNKIVRENLYLLLNSKSKEAHAISDTLQTLTSHEKTYDDWVNQKLKEVDEVFESLSTELERLHKEIHDKVEQKRSNDIVSMDKQHKKAYDFKDRLQYQVQVLGHELDQCGDHDLSDLKIKIETECNNLREDLTLDLPKLPMLRLLREGDEHRGILIKVLSKIMKTDLFNLQTTSSFEVDSDNPVFRDDIHVDLSISIPGCKYIWSVAGYDDGRMWVGSEDKMLRLLDSFGNISRCLKMSQSAVHLAVLTTGDVLCSNGYGIDRSAVIQKVSLNFNITTFSRLSPTVEVGPLASTKRGNVLVGIRNSIGRGEVLHLSTSGKTINKVAQITRDIERITTDEDERVYIKDTACIWIMSLKGEFLNQIELKHDLKGIRGIVCDRFGNLVCFRPGDINNIRVINTEGVLIKQFRLSLKSGSERDIDIGCIDINDCIWIKEEESLQVLKYLV